LLSAVQIFLTLHYFVRLQESFARAVLVADKDAPPVGDFDSNEQEQEHKLHDSDVANGDSLHQGGMRRRNAHRPAARDDSDDDTASDEEQKVDATGSGNSETKKNVKSKTDAEREEEERAKREQKGAEESSGSGCSCILWIAFVICVALITALIAASRPELADTRNSIRKVHPSLDAVVDQTEAASKWAASRLEFHLKHL
jgi:cobalamin biosynthesis Mg chelatase CobN